MTLRQRLKHLLPYRLTCAISELINEPLLAQVQRSERLTEYSWVLSQIGKHHPAGGRILDFGYAGSYFAEALCQFGPVVGCDPKKFPIRHPNFQAQWPLLEQVKFDTIVCVSVLEHIHRSAWMEVKAMHARLAPGGQVLITVPYNIQGPTHFRGYQPFTEHEIKAWPGFTAWTRFYRTPRGWINLNDWGDLAEPTASTEHTVNAIACVRLTRPSMGG